MKKLFSTIRSHPAMTILAIGVVICFVVAAVYSYIRDDYWDSIFIVLGSFLAFMIYLLLMLKVIQAVVTNRINRNKHD